MAKTLFFGYISCFDFWGGPSMTLWSGNNSVQTLLIRDERFWTEKGNTFLKSQWLDHQRNRMNEGPQVTVCTTGQGERGVEGRADCWQLSHPGLDRGRAGRTVTANRSLPVHDRTSQPASVTFTIRKTLRFFSLYSLQLANLVSARILHLGLNNIPLYYYRIYG